jgi:hypothetical protein
MNLENASNSLLAPVSESKAAFAEAVQIAVGALLERHAFVLVANALDSATMQFRMRFRNRRQSVLFYESQRDGEVNVLLSSADTAEPKGELDSRWNYIAAFSTAPKDIESLLAKVSAQPLGRDAQLRALALQLEQVLAR